MRIGSCGRLHGFGPVLIQLSQTTGMTFYRLFRSVFLLTLLAGLPLLALRVCGAGDVKLCAALALWLPGRMGAFLFGMAAAGLLLALLMLRGPQTLGELLTRSNRLHDFDDLAEVQHQLERLAARGLACQLPRNPSTA